MPQLGTPKLKTACNQPSKHDTTVLFTPSREYAAYALFTIEQIAKAHPDRDFDFCLFTFDDIAEHPLIDEYNVRICKMDASEALVNLPVNDRITNAAYFRLFASRALADDYRRILYMDCDLFYLRGNLSKLLNIDLGDHAIAGVRDPVQYRRKKHVPNDMKAFGFEYFKYMSAGVQLIDTARFNANNYGEKAIELAASHPDKMQAMDQTALNAVLKGNWAELPLIWNWLYNFRSIYYTELFDPAILHFVGRRKAWNHLNGEYPAKYSNAYRAFFKVNYPDLYEAMPLSLPPSQAKRGHLRYFIKHILDLRRFLPAMDRFKHDYDIKL